MQTDPFFSQTENQSLLVICARKKIRNAAILGIIWGVFNLLLGAFLFRVNPLNLGLLLLGLLMIATGANALRKPSLHCLLAEGFVAALLFIWNAGITVLNVREGSVAINPHTLIWPAFAAIAFFRQYNRLGHLKDAMSAMAHDTVKEATKLCKGLFKAKLKESPDIVEASSRQCRMRFMSDAVFCVQRNLAAAFYVNRAGFQECIPDMNRKRLRMVVRHPLGKLTYAFDKKNSDKIKGWLASSTAQAS
ncbi:MAG: hypothetical protein ACJ8M4_07080 [Chthoniobacterales bacterium]